MDQLEWCEISVETFNNALCCLLEVNNVISQFTMYNYVDYSLTRVGRSSLSIDCRIFAPEKDFILVRRRLFHFCAGLDRVTALCSIQFRADEITLNFMVASWDIFWSKLENSYRFKYDEDFTKELEQELIR